MTLQHTFVPEEEIQKVNQIWGNPIGGYFFQGAVGGGGGGLALILSLCEGELKLIFA